MSIFEEYGVFKTMMKYKMMKYKINTDLFRVIE